MDTKQIEALEALHRAATAGPWVNGKNYWLTGVNDGSHKDWKVPSDIGHGRCGSCSGSDQPCSTSVVDEGRTYHLRICDATTSIRDKNGDYAGGEEPDWHRIVSASTYEQIAGNYDYEEGGVCSKREDSDLIVSMRNALPALLAIAREHEQTQRDLAAAREEVEKLRATLKEWPSLECPCCGDEAVMATFFEDGQKSTCGCGGVVSADGEGAYIKLNDDEECPKCSPTTGAQR